MPIDSKECFTSLTTDGQLYEIYLAAQAGGSGNFVLKAGDTMTGKLIAAADATASKLNIGSSLGSPAPTSLVDGDIWITNQNKFAFRSSATTINAAGTNQANTFSQPQNIGSTSNAAPVLTVGNSGTREAAVFNAQGASPAVRITQTGTGEALRVEDETTPDATAFVVSNLGKVGIGVTPDASVCLSLDSTGVKFGDGTIQTTAATGSGTVTSVSATSPITSTGGTTPVISTSMATNKLLGRSTAGTGVVEEITIGTGLSLATGTLSNSGVLGVPTDASYVKTIRTLTSTQYDALGSIDPNTIYFII